MIDNSSSPDRHLSPEKANAILSGAMKQFLIHGFAATSMDRVATAAGVSKATVYNHFQDKKALFNALVRRMAQEHCASVMPEPLHGNPEVVLRHYAETMLETSTQNHEFLAFVRLVIGESERFPELSHTFLTSFDGEKDTLRQYLASQAGLSEAEADVAVFLFIGSIVHFLIHQEIMFGKQVMPIDRNGFLDQLIALTTARYHHQP